MTQQVFSNDMVSHVWAQQRQESGRSSNGQFYFQGRTLYSYGSHFPVGYVAAPGTVFLNSDGYSITTSKHKGHASSATSHYSERFYVPKLGDLLPDLQAIQRHRDEPRKGAALRDLQARTERATERLATVAPDAARWMLNQVGLKASRLDVIARRLEREAAAKLKADTREAVATWRRDAKEFGTMTARDFAAHVNGIRFQENTYRAESDLEALSRRLERAHKQAGADKHTARRATLWTRVKAVRAARKALQAAGTQTYTNNGPVARTVRAVAGIRALERHLATGEVPGPRAFDQGRAHVDTLLSIAHPVPATRAALVVLAARYAAARDALNLEAERKRFEAEREARKAWIAGETVYTRARLSDERGGALVRARDAQIDGCAVVSGELETSHGARVPLRHAARIFAFVRRVRETGETWTADSARPVRVGHFTLDSVEPSGDFVAGCHRINWSETERLARELGLWNCEPAALEALDAPELA